VYNKQVHNIKSWDASVILFPTINDKSNEIIRIIFYTKVCNIMSDGVQTTEGCTGYWRVYRLLKGVQATEGVKISISTDRNVDNEFIPGYSQKYVHPSVACTPFSSLYTLQLSVHPSVVCTPFSSLYTLQLCLRMYLATSWW
jgi:hypothetical protein